MRVINLFRSRVAATLPYRVLRNVSFTAGVKAGEKLKHKHNSRLADFTSMLLIEMMKMIKS